MSLGKAILDSIGMVIVTCVIGAMVGKPELVFPLMFSITSLWAAIDALENRLRKIGAWPELTGIV